MKKLIYLALITFALAGCEKEENLTPLDGAYSGTFRMLVDSKEQVSDFEVTLKAKRFTTTKGGAGRGPFEIISKDEIKFTDELLYTANFDWNTLLGGNYTYEIKADSLILTKKLNPAPNAKYAYTYYQYRLKKMN